MPGGMGGLGRMLMLTGALLFVIGAALTFLGRTPLGRLPGDIVVERNNFTLYFPIVTSILLSLLLTLLLSVFRR